MSSGGDPIDVSYLVDVVLGEPVVSIKPYAYGYIFPQLFSAVGGGGGGGNLIHPEMTTWITSMKEEMVKKEIETEKQRTSLFDILVKKREKKDSQRLGTPTPLHRINYKSYKNDVAVEIQKFLSFYGNKYANLFKDNAHVFFSHILVERPRSELITTYQERLRKNLDNFIKEGKPSFKYKKEKQAELKRKRKSGEETEKLFYKGWTDFIGLLQHIQASLDSFLTMLSFPSAKDKWMLDWVDHFNDNVAIQKALHLTIHEKFKSKLTLGENHLYHIAGNRLLEEADLCLQMTEGFQLLANLIIQIDAEIKQTTANNGDAKEKAWVVAKRLRHFHEDSSFGMFLDKITRKYTLDDNDVSNRVLQCVKNQSPLPTLKSLLEDYNRIQEIFKLISVGLDAIEEEQEYADDYVALVISELDKVTTAKMKTTVGFNIMMTYVAPILEVLTNFVVEEKEKEEKKLAEELKLAEKEKETLLMEKEKEESASQNKISIDENGGNVYSVEEISDLEENDHFLSIYESSSISIYESSSSSSTDDEPQPSSFFSRLTAGVTGWVPSILSGGYFTARPKTKTREPRKLEQLGMFIIRIQEQLGIQHEELERQFLHKVLEDKEQEKHAKEVLDSVFSIMQDLVKENSEMNQKYSKLEKTLKDQSLNKEENQKTKEELAQMAYNLGETSKKVEELHEQIGLLQNERLLNMQEKDDLVALYSEQLETLRSKNKKANANLLKTTNELADMRSELENKQQELRQIELSARKQIEVLQQQQTDENEKLQKVLDGLKEELETTNTELQTSKKELEKKMVESAQENDELQKKLEETENRARELSKQHSKQINDHNLRLSQLQKELEEAKKAVSSLTNSSKEGNKNLEEKKESIKLLEGRIKELISNHEKEAASVESKLIKVKDHKKSLKGSLKLQKKVINQLHVEMEEVQKKMKFQKDEFDRKVTEETVKLEDLQRSYENKLKEKQDEIDRLREENQKKIQEMAAKEAIQSLLNENLQAEQKEYENALREAEKDQAQYAKAIKESELLKKRIEELENQLNASSQKKEEYEKRVSELDEREKKLRKEKEQYDKETIAQIQKLTADKERVNKQLQDLKTKLKSQQIELNQKQDTIKQQEKSIEENKDLIRVQQKELQQIVNELNKLKENQSVEKQAEVEILEKKLADQETKLKESQQKLLQQQEMLTTTQNLNKKMEEDHRKELFDQTLKGAETEEKNQKKIKEQTTQIAQQDATLKLLQEEKEHLQGQLKKGIEDSEREKTELITNANTQIEKLQKEKEQLDEQLKKLQEDNDQKQGGLKTELENLVKDKNNLDEVRRELEKQIEDKEMRLRNALTKRVEIKSADYKAFYSLIEKLRTVLAGSVYHDFMEDFNHVFPDTNTSNKKRRWEPDLDLEAESLQSKPFFITQALVDLEKNPHPETDEISTIHGDKIKERTNASATTKTNTIEPLDDDGDNEIDMTPYIKHDVNAKGDNVEQVFAEEGDMDALFEDMETGGFVPTSGKQKYALQQIHSGENLQNETQMDLDNEEEEEEEEEEVEEEEEEEEEDDDLIFSSRVPHYNQIDNIRDNDYYDWDSW